MEAIGTATKCLRNLDPHRKHIENTVTSKIKISWMVCPGGFACHTSSVILRDIIQTVLETSECFLTKSTNNMHILASEPE